MACCTTWTLIGILIPLFGICFYWMKKKYSYWAKNEIKYAKPIPFFGSLLPLLKFTSSLDDIYCTIYNQFPNEKVIGMYEIFNPVLVIRDPELIEKILVKDFQHFVDHPSFGTNTSIFSNGLFGLNGNYWRSLRYKISPSFTTGKLKLIFSQMLDCADSLVNKLKNNKKDCEIKSYVSPSALDILATTVFGIEMKDENARNRFEYMSLKFFDTGLLYYLRQIFVILLPNVSKKLGLSIVPPDVEKYFYDLSVGTIYQRIEHKIHRNDYVQHLIKLKEKGSIEFQDKDKDEDDYLKLDEVEPQQNIEITDTLLAGQALQFLLGGFDPLVNSCLLALYELALDQNAQEKAREEIKTVLSKHGGYSYEALKEMTYVNQCLQETLRLHPLAQILMRICTKQYVTSDGVKIEKNRKIIIPLKALHKDPLYFDEPECFKPERFEPDNKIPYIYLPFGDGPRICIGMRFALMELKLIIAKLTENFSYTLNKKTKLPLQMQNLSIFPSLRTKIILDFVNIK